MNSQLKSSRRQSHSDAVHGPSELLLLLAAAKTWTDLNKSGLMSEWMRLLAPVEEAFKGLWPILLWCLPRPRRYACLIR